MARNVARNSKKQLGTKNSKAIGASLKRFASTITPWGPNVPNKRIGLTNAIGQSATGRGNTTYGSSTRKPTPDASLRGMQYAKNDPLQWPIENPPGTYTQQQDVSGITAQARTNINSSIENAYTRDGYQ
jgi:hypothetical protein